MRSATVHTSDFVYWKTLRTINCYNDTKCFTIIHNVDRQLTAFTFRL